MNLINANQQINQLVDLMKEKSEGVIGTNRIGLAKILNCSISTIDKRIHQGRDIPLYSKIGKNIFFNFYDIAEFIVNNQVKLYHEE